MTAARSDAGGRPVLTSAGRERLSGLGAPRAYSAGATLFHQGHPSELLFAIVEGRVRLVSCSAGREVLLYVATQGDVLGEAAIPTARRMPRRRSRSSQCGRWCSGASALDDSLGACPGAAPLLVALARRLDDSERKRVQFATQDTLCRLAALLVELADRFGDPTPSGTRIELPVSQEDLAGCIGASHRVVAAALQKLRKLRVVETRRRAIAVLDVEALRALGHP